MLREKGGQSSNLTYIHVCISGSTSGDPGMGDGCRNGRQATISNSKLSWSRMKKRLTESLSHVGGGARALSSASTARATATSRQGNSFYVKQSSR